MPPTQCNYEEAQQGSAPEEIPQDKVQTIQETSACIPISSPSYTSYPADYTMPLMVNTCYQMPYYYPVSTPLWIPNTGSPVLISGSHMIVPGSSPYSASPYQASPASTATASPVPFNHPDLSCSPPTQNHQIINSIEQDPVVQQQQQYNPSYQYNSIAPSQQPQQVVQYVPEGSYPSPESINPASTESYVITAGSQLERLSISNAPMYKPSPYQNLSQPNMADIWHSEFDKLFSKFPGTWSLEPRPEGVWDEHFDGIFEDTAKIRFVCKNCHHAWTSMQGKVKFWYSKNGNEGKVYFKLFGQLCRDCSVKNQVKEIQDALWYPDEIIKVVYNIHCKIGMVFYNMHEPRLMIQRRVGRPKGQHDSSLCLACREGICRSNMVKN